MENMRKFVIQSKGPIEPNEMPKPDNLPKYRGEVNLPQCGHVEPDLVPPGKLTLTMLMSAIDLKHAYHKDHEHIAAELHLSKKDVDDLLYYYKPFASFKQGAKNPKLPKHEFVQQELPAGDSVKQKLPKN